MIIYFVEIEPADESYFREAFPDQQIVFVEKLEEVPDDAELLCVFINFPLGIEFLDSHPRLRFVATRSGATDHLDVAACKERGIAGVLAAGLRRYDRGGAHLCADPQSFAPAAGSDGHHAPSGARHAAALFLRSRARHGPGGQDAGAARHGALGPARARAFAGFRDAHGGVGSHGDAGRRCADAAGLYLGAAGRAARRART